MDVGPAPAPVSFEDRGPVPPPFGTVAASAASWHSAGLTPPGQAAEQQPAVDTPELAMSQAQMCRQYADLLEHMAATQSAAASTSFTGAAVPSASAPAPFPGAWPAPAATAVPAMAPAATPQGADAATWSQLMSLYAMGLQRQQQQQAPPSVPYTQLPQTAPGVPWGAAQTPAMPAGLPGLSPGVFHGSPAMAPPTAFPAQATSQRGPWPPSLGPADGGLGRSVPGTLEGVDESLANLVMAWYYSGYYTGYYAAKQGR